MKSFLDFLNESSWRKNIYHSTDNKFDPDKIRPGTHFGDLGTAVSRGKDKYGKTQPVSVMAYDYKPSGKHVRVRDNWDDEQPESSIADQLHAKGVLDKKVAHFIKYRTKYPQRAMGRFLRRKGISHVKYKNHIEGGDSDSTIVYDTKSLKHHTFKKPNIIYPKDSPHLADDDAWARKMSRNKVFGKTGRKLDEAVSSWKPLTSFGKRLKNASSLNRSTDGNKVRRKMSSLYNKFSSWGTIEKKMKQWRELGGDKKSPKQLSLPLGSNQQSSGFPKSNVSSSSRRSSADYDDIIKNPTPKQFDDLFRGDDWLRMIKYKNNWYAWEGGTLVHDEVIRDFLGITDPDYLYGESQKKRASIFAIQIQKTYEKDTLVVYSDSINSSWIDRIKRELVKDKKFCEITKNWNVRDVHKKVPNKKPHKNELTHSQTRARIIRAMRNNLAEGNKQC